ncbi:hypothetical protein BB558_003230 [Smittium angustum]|uniref:CAP-Gly domain-containing protein n=1 Tax=Smittium angustum TaxID=133377 RepID=A0A2U1J6J2_SMIAN|nr:hypothetical protein BB558_003230 [Smittium angustum]
MDGKRPEPLTSPQKVDEIISNYRKSMIALKTPRASISNHHIFENPFNQWSPTEEENSAYSYLFTVADKKNQGKLAGEDAVSFYTKTQLSEAVLQRIWLLSDTGNKGFLTPEEFNLSLKFVSLAQNKLPVIPDNLGKQTSLPRFTGISLPEPKPQKINSSPKPISTEECSQYKRLFETSGAVNGTLSGEAAKNVLMKSKLSIDNLQQIWHLADTNNTGHLSLSGFILAMYYVRRVMNGEVPALPKVVPVSLATFIDNFTTGGRALSPPPKIEQSSIWNVSDSELLKFSKQFSLLDTENRGFVSGDVAASYFMKSKLPENELATIWDLADIHKTGKLSKGEFVAALCIIGRRIMGEKIPSSLPDELHKTAALVDSNTSRKPSLQTKISTLSPPLDKDIFANVQSKPSQTASISQEISDLNSQISSLSAENNMFIQRKISANTNIIKLESEKQGLIAVLEALKRSADSEKKLALDLESKIEITNNEINDLVLKNEYEKNRQSDLEENNSLLLSKYNSTMDQVFALKEAFTFAINQNTKLEDELNNISSLKNQLDLNLQSEYQRLNQLQKDVELKETELEHKKQEFLSKESELNSKKQECLLKEAELERIKEESFLKGSELERIKEEILLRQAELEHINKESLLKDSELERIKEESLLKRAELERIKEETLLKKAELERKTEESLLKKAELERKTEESLSKDSELESTSRNIEVLSTPLPDKDTSFEKVFGDGATNPIQKPYQLPHQDTNQITAIPESIWTISEIENKAPKTPKQSQFDEIFGNNDFADRTTSKQEKLIIEERNNNTQNEKNDLFDQIFSSEPTTENTSTGTSSVPQNVLPRNLPNNQENIKTTPNLGTQNEKVAINDPFLNIFAPVIESTENNLDIPPATQNDNTTTDLKNLPTYQEQIAAFPFPEPNLNAASELGFVDDAGNQFSSIQSTQSDSLGENSLVFNDNEIRSNEKNLGDNDQLIRNFETDVLSSQPISDSNEKPNEKQNGKIDKPDITKAQNSAISDEKSALISNTQDINAQIQLARSGHSNSFHESQNQNTIDAFPSSKSIDETSKDVFKIDHASYSQDSNIDSMFGNSSLLSIHKLEIHGASSIDDFESRFPDLDTLEQKSPITAADKSILNTKSNDKIDFSNQVTPVPSAISPILNTNQINSQAPTDPKIITGTSKPISSEAPSKSEGTGMAETIFAQNHIAQTTEIHDETPSINDNSSLVANIDKSVDNNNNAKVFRSNSMSNTPVAPVLHSELSRKPTTDSSLRDAFDSLFLDLKQSPATESNFSPHLSGAFESKPTEQSKLAHADVETKSTFSANHQNDLHHKTNFTMDTLNQEEAKNDGDFDPFMAIAKTTTTTSVISTNIGTESSAQRTSNDESATYGTVFKNSNFIQPADASASSDADVSSFFLNGSLERIEHSDVYRTDSYKSNLSKNTTSINSSKNFQLETIFEPDFLETDKSKFAILTPKSPKTKEFSPNSQSSYGSNNVQRSVPLADNESVKPPVVPKLLKTKVNSNSDNRKSRFGIFNFTKKLGGGKSSRNSLIPDSFKDKKKESSGSNSVEPGNQYSTFKAKKNSPLTKTNSTRYDNGRSGAQLRTSKSLPRINQAGADFSLAGKPWATDIQKVKMNNELVSSLDGNDSLMLGYFGIDNYDTLEVSGSRPNFKPIVDFDDLSKIEKYEMPKEEYEKRQDSVLAYKMRNKLGRFTENSNEKVDETTSLKEAESLKSLSLGSRCEVSMSDSGLKRRGTIRFIGPTEFAKGIWVGIEYDEPLGKNDGSVQGTRYFNCQPNYGSFVKPELVVCGDFPETMDFSDEELEEL